tara:strand:- start:1887 stop:2318 length:432 start_codon:yes stop_codon:yes gene_type:complete
MRKFFDNPTPYDGVDSLYTIVVALMQFEEINDLKDRLGEEKYNKLREDVNKHQELYAFSALIRKTITELRGKESEASKMVASELVKIMAKVALQLPLIKRSIIESFILLVNNTELKNQPVPRQRAFPGKFQQTEGVRFGESYY